MMVHQEEPNAEPILSVVVLIGSQRERAIEAVNRLLAQNPSVPLEVIVVDAAPEAGALPWLDRPEIRHVPMAELASIAEGKVAGARLARGRHLAFLEDHCHAEPGWAAAVVEGFEQGADVVAYAFGNLNPVNYVSRAFLLLAYGPWSSPVASGFIESPSWMNVAYRADLIREHLDELGDLLQCESLFQASLRRRGLRFWQAGKAEVRHLNHTRLLGACRDCAAWQRLFAATRARVQGWTLSHWVIHAAAAPWLSPTVIAWRLGRRLWARRELRLPFLRSLPLIMAVYHYGSFHEALGCLFGPGSAERDSVEVETGDPRSPRRP
jgi:hypothetical protein